jgi:hypothetical protein
LAYDCLAKNNVTTLEYTAYSPDFDPADCYLLPLLKSGLKGRRSCKATDIIKNATEELKRPSQNGFVYKTFTVAGRSE